MKKIIISLTVIISISNFCSAQYINWNSNNLEKRNNVFMNVVYDYSLSLNAGYNRSMNIFNKPVLLGLDFSVPAGKNLFDDHKIKIGGEIELLNKNNFYVSAKVKGVIRRYKSIYTRIENFGSDVGLTVGYYKPKWYIATNFGFDKAISSHLKHTETFKEIYPLVQDGWYKNTGGNFYLGLDLGATIKENLGISFKVGITNAEGKDVNALLPYYIQIGLNKTF